MSPTLIIRGVALSIVVDHSSDESTKLIDRAFSETGRIDVLVNNAYGGVFAIGETFGKFWRNRFLFGMRLITLVKVSLLQCTWCASYDKEQIGANN